MFPKVRNSLQSLPFVRDLTQNQIRICCQEREKAVAINEQLQQEAKAVLDVIENPDVAQALRQDKNQNLAYLKDNYDVSDDVLYALNICRDLPPDFCSSPSSK
jgi:hypothetical protein